MVISETLQVELVGNHICAVIPTGHYTNNIKGLQAKNYDGGRNRQQGTLDIRNDYAEENFKFFRAVNASCLKKLRGDTFNRAG